MDARRSDPLAPPAPALWLGWAGLLPFVGLSVAASTGWGLAPDLARRMLIGYGVAILSFLGGVQWGLAAKPGEAARFRLWRRYLASVAPPLAAWAALALPPPAALAALAIGLAMVLVYDLWLARQGEAPAWYGRLRLPLGIGATVCVVTPTASYWVT